jgi:hypothetical protein
MTLASIILDLARVRTFEPIDANLQVLDVEYGRHVWKKYPARMPYRVPLTVCIGDLGELCKRLQVLRDSCPENMDAHVVWEPRALGKHDITRIGEYVHFGLRWVVVANGGRRMPLHGEIVSGVYVGEPQREPLVSFEFALRRYYEKRLSHEDV